MKRVFIIILFLILLITLFCVLSQKHYKYPVGRDTYDVFGDGSFQLNKYYVIDPNGEHEKKVFLGFRGEVLEKEVFEYFTYNSLLFTHGENGYVICDFKENKYYIYNDLNKLPYEYSQITKKNKFHKINRWWY